MFENFTLSLHKNSKKVSPDFLEDLFTTKLKSSDNPYWMPDLLSKGDPFENEYSLEWKSHMLLKNADEVKKCRETEERFTFYTSNIVRSVFDICKVLRQPPETRYLAIEILDRFLINHFFGVVRLFEDMDNKSTEIWQVIVQRILDQSLLRILSCVQLANKFSWTNNIISCGTIQELMLELGHRYQFSKKNIIKSELRVYQTLNFAIPLRTPLTYIEMYFDEFQKLGYFPINTDLGKFFTICVHVLDVAIVYHQQIYSNLLNFISCEQILKDYFCIAAFKGDLIVLGASVIFASYVLINSKIKSEVLLKILCRTGECKQQHVQTLGMELLKVVQKYK